MIDCVSPLRIRCKVGIEGGREDILERLNSILRFLYRVQIRATARSTASKLR
jgi:hypothetical protein